MNLYYNAASDNAWDTLSNWWEDSSYTIPASALPGSGDNAYLDMPIFVGPSTPTTVSSVFVGSINTATFDVDLSNLSVSTFLSIENQAILSGMLGTVALFQANNSATISGSFVLGGGVATFYDDTNLSGTIENPSSLVIFNNSASNQGGVNYDAEFNQFATNVGMVVGNATFNRTEYDANFTVGTVSGMVTVNGPFIIGEGQNWSGNDSGWGGTRTWQFDSDGQNSGTITGVSVFNNLSANSGLANGGATFNDDSINNSSGEVVGNVTFNDTSWNDGTVTGNATFDLDSSELNNSFAVGTVTGSVTVNGGFELGSGQIWGGDDSTWLGARTWLFNVDAENQGTLHGNATFQDNAWNSSGTVYPTTVAVFTGSAHNDAVVEGDAAFNVSAYNASTGSVVGDAEFTGNTNNAGTVSGHAEFSGFSYNAGTVDSAEFSENAKNGDGTGSGTITNDASLEDNAYVDGGSIGGDTTFTNSAAIKQITTTIAFAPTFTGEVTISGGGTAISILGAGFMF